LFPGLINIAIISAIFTLLFVFIDIPKSVLCYNILESKKKYSRLKSEYIVYAGIAYALWEMLTFICILFIWNISHEWLKILFLILSFFVLISACLFCKISKGEILAKNI
jgi:nitrate reductase NapE component